MLRTSQACLALKFGLCHFILEQLELREWTQQDFAEITGFTQTHISELLHDNTTLGFDTASILGKVFETSTD